jgi:purine-binding chemotaxis protein CheW
MAELTKAMDQAVNAMADREGKYLTFTLDREEYGIGILKIKEIIGMMPVTAVPQTPEYVKGVINLRGKVIPVVDLRLRFGMDSMEYNERTCIIVVEIKGQSGNVLIGTVVESRKY